MQFVNNEPEQIEIRKSQNTLIVVGSGIVLFSIWSMVKFLSMLFLLRNETVAGVMSIAGPVEGISDRAAFWVIAIVTIVIMSFISFRIYVGLSAIAEGRGKRRGYLYIIIAMIMIISSVWYLFIGFTTSEAPEQLGAFTRNQSISTLIIDATSMIMLIQMVISAIKIKKLTGTGRKTKD